MQNEEINKIINLLKIIKDELPDGKKSLAYDLYTLMCC